MSSFARRNEGNESYMMNQPLAMPSPYGHPDGHEFGATGSGSYHQFSHQSFHPYGSQFGPSYAQQGLHHLQQYSSDHSIPSMSSPENMRLHHPPPQYLAQPRFPTSPRYVPLSETEIESQSSQNEGSMQSEPVLPPLEGFPDVKEFDQLMQSYVDDLSVKKQDKALIHSKRARNIKAVLNEPKDTSVESAQFRFWVKKMFKLQTVGIVPDCRKMICHEGKPVAIREKLFKILTKAHQLCQHGGRDKTSAQVRRIYSWVPKELISRFVKICPTCQVRRGGSRLTPPNSRRSSPRLDLIPRSPKLPSPPISRRESTLGGQAAVERQQTTDYFSQLSQLHTHNGWLDGHHGLQGRSTVGTGPVRSFQGPIGHLSMPGTLDPFSTDLSVPPSQLHYTSYISTHTPTQREY